MLSKTLFVALILVIGAGRAECQAMDLQDPRARWVSVQFERSPAGSPGQLDSHYAPALPAWFEPGPHGERVSLTIDREIVEHQLFRDTRPVPDSFSDFVWMFDIETGHVTSARLSGALFRPLRWGFVQTTAEVQIRVDMNTVRQAGFREASSLLGNELFRVCHEFDSSECTLVDPQELDRGTGYVNAVGALEADSVLSVRTFSPLGEAVFRELMNQDIAWELLHPGKQRPTADTLPPVAATLRAPSS